MDIGKKMKNPGNFIQYRLGHYDLVEFKYARGNKKFLFHIPAETFTEDEKLKEFLKWVLKEKGIIYRRDECFFSNDFGCSFFMSELIECAKQIASGEVVLDKKTKQKAIKLLKHQKRKDKLKEKVLEIIKKAKDIKSIEKALKRIHVKVEGYIESEYDTHPPSGKTICDEYYTNEFKGLYEVELDKLEREIDKLSRKAEKYVDLLDYVLKNMWFEDEEKFLATHYGADYVYFTTTDEATNSTSSVDIERLWNAWYSDEQARKRLLSAFEVVIDELSRNKELKREFKNEIKRLKKGLKILTELYDLEERYDMLKEKLKELE